MAAIIPKEMRFRFNLWRQSRHLAGLSALNGFLTIDFSHFTPLLDAPTAVGNQPREFMESLQTLVRWLANSLALQDLRAAQARNSNFSGLAATHALTPDSLSQPTRNKNMVE